MRYLLHFGPDALVVEMTGNFTFSDTKQFHGLMAAIRSKATRGKIELNIRHLVSIDSTGLRFLMMAHDFAKKSHRILVFVAPQGQVYEALSEAAQYNCLNIAA